MEWEMEINYETWSSFIPELEGVLVTEKGGEFSPPANVPIIDYSVPPIMEQPSSQDPSFSIQTPIGVMLNQFHPDDLVSTMFVLIS